MSAGPKRLEARGLVQRIRRPDDERSVEVRLTEAVTAMRAEASSVPDELTCALGPDDRAIGELRSTLHRLATSLGRPGTATA